MARGFLSGAVLGLAVSFGAAVGLSLVVGGPVLREQTPEAAAVDVPAGAEFNGARDDRKATLPSSEPVTAPESGVSKPAVPEPDTLARLDGADTAPGQQPQAGDVANRPNQPGSDTGNAADVAPMVEPEDDAPVQSGGQVSAPQAPKVEPGLAISTTPAEPSVQSAAPQAMVTVEEPAATDTAVPEASISSVPDQPKAPSVETEESAFAPATTPQTAPEQTPAVTTTVEPTPEPEVDSAPTPSAQVDAPSAPVVPQVEEATGIAPNSSSMESEPASEPKRAATPSTVAAPAQPVPQETPVIVVQPETPKADPPAAPQTNAEAEPEPQQPEAEDGSGTEEVAAIRIGKPASNLKKLATGVQTGRLPSLTQGGTQTGTQATSAPASGSAMPPVKRFAIAFQGDENKPKMAIVLIDEGKGPVGVEALSTFPYPLSFAVDASRDDAAEVMASYRAAGFEVLAMVRLAPGSRPSDVEVAMPVLLANVPEAVGVMEAPGNGIQFDRKVSDQVARILGDSGHGLLLYPKGLNTAQKLAAKNGVPSTTIFRDIDAKDQKASAIRRFLNYGALNAGNEGGVVMVGRLRADTVTALLLWGLEDRASQVNLAPVSQLLSTNP